MTLQLYYKCIRKCSIAYSAGKQKKWNEEESHSKINLTLLFLKIFDPVLIVTFDASIFHKSNKLLYCTISPCRKKCIMIIVKTKSFSIGWEWWSNEKKIKFYIEKVAKFVPFSATKSNKQRSEKVPVNQNNWWECIRFLLYIRLYKLFQIRNMR